jgi:DNA-binding transcriptional regulator YhcF (GntR family)
MAGWQKIYRDIQSHWLWTDKPFSRGQAWIDLILSVNHEENKTLIDGELIEVKRGSKITSLRKLSEQWGWSTNKTTKFLNQLEKDNMIKYKSDNKKTLITIENYSFYQGGENTEETQKKQLGNTDETQKKNKRNSDEIQKKTNKNDKENIKNDKEGEERKEENKIPSLPTQTHELILNHFGEVGYSTWFKDCTIEEKDQLLTITVQEEIQKKMIETAYLKKLNMLTGKKVSVKVGE